MVTRIEYWNVSWWVAQVRCALTIAPSRTKVSGSSLLGEVLFGSSMASHLSFHMVIAHTIKQPITPRAGRRLSAQLFLSVDR